MTDMESAIVRSIREQTSLTQLGCWRHLRQDVQRWIAENYPRIHRAKYINDLYEILRSKTNAECQNVTNDKKSSWEEGFIKYFERHVETKLKYFVFGLSTTSVHLTKTMKSLQTNQKVSISY